MAQQDRTIVITGASSGIGKAGAELFGRMGWHVIGVGRDPARCKEAEAELRAIPDAHIDFLRGDFAEMAQVRRVAREITGLTDRIDVLVNNAGGIRDALYLSSEGLEATFAANHLAPFLLTRELLPLLERAKQARVIAVSSLAHVQCKAMHWDDLMLLDDFAVGPAYCQAKLANLLFTRELDRRVSIKGITAQTMHPGTVGSNFWSHGDTSLQAYGAGQDLITPEHPARTIAWLATAPETGIDGGRFFHDLAEVQPAPQALDDQAAERLWRESERILETL